MKETQERWLRIRDVQALFSGRSRASIYRDVARGHLPPPVKMGEINYWSQTALRAWLERRSKEQSLTAAE